jgi:hypothetical protein
MKTITGGPLDPTWGSQGLPSGATVTFNAGAAPASSCDTGTTATRVQSAATAAGQYSSIITKAEDGAFNNFPCPEAGGSGSPVSVAWEIVSHDHASSGSTNVCLFDQTHAWRCTTASFTGGYATGKFENVPWIDCAAGGADSCQILIGNATIVNGGTALAAVDFDVYGFTCVLGATAQP